MSGVRLDKSKISGRARQGWRAGCADKGGKIGPFPRTLRRQAWLRQISYSRADRNCVEKDELWVLTAFPTQDKRLDGGELIKNLM